MNFLVKVKKLVKNEFEKMVWQRNMLLRFCHHKLIPTFKNTVASVTKWFDVFMIVSNPTFLRSSKIASLKFLFPIFHG